jgi:hypothetical protein
MRDWKTWLALSAAFIVPGLAVVAAALLVVPTNLAAVNIGLALTAIGLLLAVLAFLVSPARTALLQWMWSWMPMRRSLADLQVVKIPGPSNLAGVHSFQFISGQQTARVVSANPGLQRTALPSAPVPHQPPPSRIDFKSPQRVTIRATDLPSEINGRRGRMTVFKFINGGFVLNEGSCAGDKVTGDIYF